MTPKQIAAQAAADFYGAPGINEDWEKWLSGQIQEYGELQVRRMLEAIAQNKVSVLQNALKEIKKGQGRYSKDPLIHAGNTIEDMVKLASDALLDFSHEYPPI